MNVVFPGSQSDTYQEDIYPMTAGTEPALSASEWLSGINRGNISVIMFYCFKGFRQHFNRCTCSIFRNYEARFLSFFD